MLVGYALVPLIVAAFLLIGLRWRHHETGWVVLTVTICEASIVPALHQTTGALWVTISQRWDVFLPSSAIMLSALFFASLQYATMSCVPVVQSLVRLVPSRDLLSLLLVLGVGPCLTSLCGQDVGMILIMPLLACLHLDRATVVELGLLSQLFTAWGSLGTGILLLVPVLLGASVVVAWLSRRTPTSHLHWGTALSAVLVMMLVIWFCGPFLTMEATSLFASSSAIGVLLLRGAWKRSWPADPVRQRSVTPGMNRFFPYVVLLVGCCLSQFFFVPLPWGETLRHLLPVLSLPIVSSCLPGLWLLLGAFAFLLHAPLPRTHLLHVQRITWRSALPIVVTAGCFLSTFLVMQACGLFALLEHALDTLGVPTAWVTVLLGAIGGWLSHGNLIPPTLLVASHHTLSVSWMTSAHRSAAWLASTVSPATMLLAMTVAGSPKPETAVRRWIGCVVLWGLAMLLCFTAGTWWMCACMLVAATLAIGIPVFQSGITRVLVPTFSLGLSVTSRTRRVLKQGLAYGTLILVNVLYASSSLVSLGPLSRLDPLIFLCLQMLLLVPVGGLLLFGAHVPLRRSILMRGLQLGACLAAGLLCVALSIKETGIMETTIFACLNGVIAMLLARWLFGQRLSRWNGCASLCLLLGAFLVWLTAPLDWQGNMTAFVAGLLLTYDGFQVEQLLADYGPEQTSTIRALLGAQCLAMAVLTTIVALCFGHWDTLHFLVPSDGLTLCYLSFVTILLPCALMLWAQRTLSAVTVACFSVIEPFAGMAASVLLAGERLPLLAVLGGGVVLVGMVLQMVASFRQDGACAPSTPPGPSARGERHTKGFTHA